MTTVVVFGGSGFLGRRLVRRLAGDGLNVRVAVRHPAAARRILRATGLDRVVVQRADVCDQATVAAAIAGADAVVNAVSAYVERGDETFEAVHERGAERVARGAATAGVARLVLVSGIGADPASLRGLDLAKANLAGADCRKADLRGTILSGATLTDANLAGANFFKSVLDAADLAGANLIGAQFLNCAQLTTTRNWQLAFRDPDLACGAPVPMVADPP